MIPKKYPRDVAEQNLGRSGTSEQGFWKVGKNIFKQSLESNALGVQIFLDIFKYYLCFF